MGHPPQVVWSYTPRQLVAFLSLASDRKRKAAAEELFIGFLSSRGEEKEIKKNLKEWGK